jgi:hypothetical protein
MTSGAAGGGLDTARPDCAHGSIDCTRVLRGHGSTDSARVPLHLRQRLAALHRVQGPARAHVATRCGTRAPASLLAGVAPDADAGPVEHRQEVLRALVALRAAIVSQTAAPSTSRGTPWPSK